MLIEMEKRGWTFAGTAGGRLVFRNGDGETVVFKTWADVKKFAFCEND